MRSLHAILSVLALATSILGTPNPATTTACSALQHQLGTATVQTSSGPEYLNASTNAWNLFNDIQRPACIVFPESAGDVQAAMTMIFNHNIHYAVQAGSHTAMEGWNKYV